MRSKQNKRDIEKRKRKKARKERHEMTNRRSRKRTTTKDGSQPRGETQHKKRRSDTSSRGSQNGYRRLKDDAVDGLSGRFLDKSFRHCLVDCTYLMSMW